MSAVEVGELLLERHGGVQLILVNRPERSNSIGGTVLRDLADAFDEAAHDDDVRVVVTSGVGRSFSVGADSGELAGGDRPPARELLNSPTFGGLKGLKPLSSHQTSLEDLGNPGRWTLRMWDMPKPTIAAVNGVAVGGGFGLALLHDIVLAGESARLGPGFAPIGLAPEMGISHLLPRLVGASKAAELFFTGQLVSGEEARRIGLAAEVVPDGQLLDRALEMASRIAAMPPLGIQSSKKLLRRSIHGHLAEQLRAEYAAQMMLFDHPETNAAISALVERLSRPKGDGGA